MGPFVRIVLIAVVIWLVVRFVQKWLAGAQPRHPTPIDEVVPCAYCGTYVPRSTAIRADGHLYCSQQHVNKEK